MLSFGIIITLGSRGGHWDLGADTRILGRALGSRDGH